MTNRLPLDPIGREYARLAFGIERHVPGYIDAWLGSDADRAALEPDELPEPSVLLLGAGALLDQVRALDADAIRTGYLSTQINAMMTTLRRLAGEDVPYREEVSQLFDIAPSATPESVFEAAIADLNDLLPGEGSVAERMIAWRQQYAVSPAVAERLVDLILPELKARAESIVDLDFAGDIEIRMVADKPWSGYNWFLGGGRSRVELNTDLPIYAYRLTDLLAHEAYPGHHTEHALKERLYTVHGLGEHSLQLINTPECVISEGIATHAEEMIFSPEDLVRFRRETLYPAAGIDGDPEREIAIGAALHALRSVTGNAALLLHEECTSAEEVGAYLQRYGLSTEAEARNRLRFIADPLWRAYIFTYHAGYDLLAAWFDVLPEGERRAAYRTLLTEQVYPSQIAAWTAAAVTATPP